jgi:hypothetical protein
LQQVLCASAQFDSRIRSKFNPRLGTRALTLIFIGFIRLPVPNRLLCLAPTVKMGRGRLENPSSSEMFSLFKLALLALGSSAAFINVARDVEPAEADLAVITQDLTKISTDLQSFRNAPTLVQALVRCAHHHH